MKSPYLINRRSQLLSDRVDIQQYFIGEKIMKNLTLATIFAITATTTDILLQSTPARAANLSFTGNLATPNATPLFSFIADGTSNVTIRSYSWGGGTNAAGTTISPGGFDLNLTLFDAAGNWYDERDDDIGLDFQFTGILPAGNYQVAIAAFGNNSAGFGNITTPFNRPIRNIIYGQKRH